MTIQKNRTLTPIQSPAEYRLKLSTLVYLDKEIDHDQAGKFVVYHYPFHHTGGNRYKWNEKVKNVADQALLESSVPFLVRSDKKGRHGIFIAILDSKQHLPVIKNGGEIITPIRVEYAPEYNPVWIRLLFRSLFLQGSNHFSSQMLGNPLLKIDSWGQSIDAVTLDCRTGQLKDKATTEIYFSSENVLLKEFDTENYQLKDPNPYWVYDKNNILKRIDASFQEKNSKKVIYGVVPKASGTRKNRPFIDVSSAKNFALSRPVIFEPIQKQFIDLAKKYGFTLKPKFLNLQELPAKVKYKSNANARRMMAGVVIPKKIRLLDLRYCRDLPLEDLKSFLDQVFKSKNIEIEMLPVSMPEAIGMENFSDITPELLLSKLSREDEADIPILSLVDQIKGMKDDRYLLTELLRTKIACQHININPYELVEEQTSAERGLVEEVEKALDNGKKISYLVARDQYYQYSLQDFTKEKVESLKRNLEICLKELAIKHLLLSKGEMLSEILPQESEVMNDDLLMISQGYLFVVKNDRPILIPFQQSNQEYHGLCNQYLSSFGLTVESLRHLVEKEWPYNYGLREILEGSSYKGQDPCAIFVRRLTVLITKTPGKVNILLHDNDAKIPVILPDNLPKAMKSLQDKACKKSIDAWRLPQQDDVLVTILQQLLESGAIKNAHHRDEMIALLPSIRKEWNRALSELSSQDSQKKITFDVVRKACFKGVLEDVNKTRAEGEKLKKFASHIYGIWQMVGSELFQMNFQDIRSEWLKHIPGVSKLWHDPAQGYYIVGVLAPLKTALERQPSIRQWHVLQGELDTELLLRLVDVDWVRLNQFAGNPFITLLINRWKDCQLKEQEYDAALLP